MADGGEAAGGEGESAAAAAAGPSPSPAPSPAPSPGEDEKTDEGGEEDQDDGEDGEEGKEGADAPKEEGGQGGEGEGGQAGDGKDGKKKRKKPKEPAPPKVLKDKTMGCLKHEDLDWIWIGDADDARDAVALKKNSVRYILNCTPTRNDGGVLNFHEKDPYFSYCRVAMGDNATELLSSRFEEAWEFLERVRVREDGAVLVHCQQGVSRSCSMVISYLMKYYRYSYEDALVLVKDSRKQACPNEGFAQQLKDLDENLRKTNGWEKRPPKRSKLAVGPGPPAARVGPAVGPGPRPAAGPARGPVGPARPAPGPAVGPAAGPTKGPVAGPPVGPARGPVGPQRGPAAGPAPPPPAGAAKPPKAEKRKAAGPAAPPRAEEGPAKPKKVKSSDAIDLTA